jgi:hypothetical protein
MIIHGLKYFETPCLAGKNVGLPCTLVGEVFHQDAWKVSEWQAVIDRSELFFDDMIVAFGLRHVLLSCSIVHHDGRV